MNNMTDNKISFTEQIRIALSKPLWYKSLFRQSIGKHLCYFLILITLTTVIQYVIPVAAYLQSMGGLQNLILTELPEFVLEGGTLTVSDTIELEQDGAYLLIDTSAESYTASDAQQKAEELGDSETTLVYLVSRTNIVSNQMYMPLSLSALNGLYMDNQTLYQEAPVYLTIAGICVFFYTIIGYLLNAVLYALFGYLMSRVLKLQLNFGQIYLIALYAKSIELLLESVLQVIGLSLLYYIGSIVGIFITCNYMTRGMSSMMAKAADGRFRD